jgi:hypothetical protein
MVIVVVHIQHSTRKKATPFMVKIRGNGHAYSACSSCHNEYSGRNIGDLIENIHQSHVNGMCPKYNRSKRLYPELHQKLKKEKLDLKTAKL